MPFTVIIPAHNEESVILRCLCAMTADAPADNCMEIIVVANGCSDRTVDIARAADPRIVVLDLPAGSKTAAINAGNERATHFPRLVVDADVECNYTTLAALAATLREPGVMTAAPAIRMNLSRCSVFMKAYYRAWSRQPYARAGKGGAGCYGLSETAITTVGSFPAIIGDDIWIHTRFPDSVKRYVDRDASGQPVFSTVYPPTTARQQIKVEARRQNGNAQVRRLHPSPYFANANHGGGWKAALTSGTSPFDLVVFFAIKLAARVLARVNRRRKVGQTWARDLSTRSG